MNKERILFIDALRGYAILMMLQGHTVGVVLEEKLRSSDYAVYNTWNFFRGITAPAFLFASGLIVAYLFFSSDAEKRSLRVRKSIDRGFVLLVLGSLVLVKPSTFSHLFSGEWQHIHFYKHTMVLHIIGIALIVTAGVFKWLGNRPAAVLTSFSVLTLLGYFGHPWLASWDSGLGVVDFFTAPRSGSVFLLTPWLGHYFLGCIFGYWTSKTRWYLNVKILIGMIFVGLVCSQNLYILHRIIINTEWFSPEGADLFQKSYDQIYRLGNVMTLTGIIALFIKLVKAPGWLLQSGKETLSIFVLHCLVVYSAVFGVGYATSMRRALNGWESAGLSLATMVLFIVIASQLPRWRERVKILKWIQ
ncbi:DUF1624 domain-containing protein [Akkermansiaceae bacterium]|nr:DUF1624 domain-containing protein [Akkermansiaceae bacterium]